MRIRYLVLKDNTIVEKEMTVYEGEKLVNKLKRSKTCRLLSYTRI